MSSNPFTSRERQHFPEFSPMFRKKTPTSTEKQPGFRWSIDQIARLKPADIDTDPATLVQTNGHSPDNHADAQKDVDKFFSQKTILPSPWPTTTQTSRLQLPTKRVTFSPHPPSTAFIQEDTGLFESEMRDSRTADAGTQTALTFPMNFDLEHLLGQCLLGQVMNHVDEDSARDLGNSSLRRKLFGKPDRQGSPDSIDGSDGDTVSPVPMVTVTHPSVELSHKGLVVPPTFTPISKKSYSKTSLPSGTSTPLHPSHSPADYLHSPAIIFTKPVAAAAVVNHDQNQRENLKEDAPAHSSMILQTPGKCTPFFSPIGSDDDRVQSSSDGGLINGDGGRSGHSCVSDLFPVTPSKADMEEDQLKSSPPPLSPIMSTPAPLAAVSPMVVGEGSKVRSDVGSKHGSNQVKCTSTPNTGVMKRQLAASPFASPVLKHPCTTRQDMEDEDEEADNQLPLSPISSKQQTNDSDLSEEMAQPLSLADLHTNTFTYDLTNVTSTAGYTAMDLGETNFDDNTAANIRQHPLHSTAALLAPSMWHPPIQSILGDSQSYARLNSLTQQQQQPHLVAVDASQTKLNMLSQQNQGSIGGIHVPYSRNWSGAQAPISMSVGQSGIDSGVAVAFSETHMNSKFGSGMVDSESGLSCSLSKSNLPSMSSERECCRQTDRQGDGVTADSNDCKIEDSINERCIKSDNKSSSSKSSVVLTPFRDNPTSTCTMRVDSKHQMLSTIKESVENHHDDSSSGLVTGSGGDGVEMNIQSEKKTLHTQFDRDSGLFSPDVKDNVRSMYTANFYHKEPSTTRLYSGLNAIASHNGLTPPSRHSNLYVPSAHQKFVTNPQHVTNSQLTSGTVPITSSNAGSKFTTRRGITHTSVLPSRLKLASGTLHLSSSSSPTRTQTYSPMSTNVTPHATTGVSTSGLGVFGCAQSFTGSEVRNSFSPSLHRTPPSRYSSSLGGSIKLLGRENSSCISGGGRKTGLTGFPGDVLRKKETLKARLQFSNPVSNNSSCNLQYDSRVEKGQRIPLGETSLNCPKTPLASMTTHFNEGCSPLSPSPINLIRSPWQQPLAFSPLHRPTSITSLSHASHVTRWKNQT